MPAFIQITANGSVLEGYTSMTEVAGESIYDYLELSSFSIGWDRNVDATTASVRGHLQPRRLVLTKRFDAASPLLLSALARGESIEAVLKIFDNGPDGADRLMSTWTVHEARLTDIDWDGVSGSDASTPAVEETLRLAYTSIDVEYTGDSQTEATVDWAPAGA